MTPACNKCLSNDGIRPKIIRRGFYYRASDSRYVQRFRCQGCYSEFSHATNHPCARQKKRHQNETIRRLLASGMTQRRIAIVLKLNRKTVVRKFLFLGMQSRERWMVQNRAKPKARTVEFDDLETFEHTKCKPLSVTLLVEHGSRRILGLRVSSMPSRGPLAERSRQKYGPRVDERRAARRELFGEIQELVHEDVVVKSDQNPHYPLDVKTFFPSATHERHKGRRGAITGQGELKRIGFDPLFSLNHTCAMLRANINRLFRRTWSTTKIAARLELHLYLYAHYHNETLI